MSLEQIIREAVHEACEPLRRELEQLRAVVGGNAGTADRFLTPKEAHALTGYAAETVKRWARDGQLKRYGTARAVRVSELELRNLLATGNGAGQKDPPRPTPRDIVDLAHQRAARKST